MLLAKKNITDFKIGIKGIDEMRIKEIIKYVVNDNIVIDKEVSSGDWIKVYSGSCHEIPVNLLESEVKFISPLNRGIIEIAIL